jgi:hypothetical protein
MKELVAHSVRGLAIPALLRIGQPYPTFFESCRDLFAHVQTVSELATEYAKVGICLVYIDGVLA